MREITYYESFDGRKFDTEAACVAYEAEWGHWDGVYGWQLRPKESRAELIVSESVEEILKRADILYLPKESYVKLNDYNEEEFGFEFPDGAGLSIYEESVGWRPAKLVVSEAKAILGYFGQAKKDLEERGVDLGWK